MREMKEDRTRREKQSREILLIRTAAPNCQYAVVLCRETSDMIRCVVFESREKEKKEKSKAKRESERERKIERDKKNAIEM